MTVIKPYRSMPIAECGEPMLPIPAELFLLTEPHPYKAVGASYGDASPWMLRQGVLQALLTAQQHLAAQRPGWRFKLFDAYRPNEVQAYMVELEFRQHSGGRPSAEVAEPERNALYDKVFRLWAMPSADPATPPPHSTGGAVDLTIADADGLTIDMGSPIDENSDRSLPDYFQDRDPLAHANRSLLYKVMRTAGFHRHPAEWWHFSLGDQLWAWLNQQDRPDDSCIARYGRAALLNDRVKPQP